MVAIFADVFFVVVTGFHMVQAFRLFIFILHKGIGMLLCVIMMFIKHCIKPMYIHNNKLKLRRNIMFHVLFSLF